MWGKAEFHFKEAVQERPRYASPHYGLGSVALMKSSQTNSMEQVQHYAKEGVAHFGRAIELNPHYTKAMWGLIRCHMILGKLAESQGNTKDAMEAYQTAQSQFQEMIRIDRQYALSKPERVQIFDEIQKRLDYFKHGP
jgi:tetratricopeptide (TPR) repeat protein